MKFEYVTLPRAFADDIYTDDAELAAYYASKGPHYMWSSDVEIPEPSDQRIRLVVSNARPEVVAVMAPKQTRYWIYLSDDKLALETAVRPLVRGRVGKVKISILPSTTKH